MMMFACTPVDEPVKPEEETPTEKPEEKPEEKPDEKPEENPEEKPEETPTGLKPILDVVFNANGTATDASETKIDVKTLPSSTLFTYYSDYSKGYVARFNNNISTGITSGFYKADYSSNNDFKNRLSDGHSMEVMFMLGTELPADAEVKMFSSHQSGGTGFLISKAERNKQISFISHVGGGYKWAESGITPKVGQYYHAVGVWDKEAGKCRLYVDGELKSEVNATGDFKMVPAASQWFGIGADPSSEKGTNAWNGDVVLARVYDEALTAEQVKELKDKADYKFPVSDINVEGIFYLSGMTFAKGGEYKILGKGFKTGDKVVWESASGYKATVDGTVSEMGISVKLPADLADGNYSLRLERAGSTLLMGSVDIKVSASAPDYKAPKVIAHRCYHASGAPQNSIAALAAAQKLGGVYGGEIDVFVTKDDVVVVNHDKTFSGKTLETSNYADVKDLTLSNGEKLPTLEAFLEQLKKDPSVKLIIEVKNHSDAARGLRCVDVAMDLVEKAGLKNQVEYIAFSFTNCKRIVENDPTAIVGYLNGDLAPANVNAAGIKSIDYKSDKLTKQWTDEAHKLGMIVNTWTINSDADMIKFIEMGVDYITTDHPDRLKEINWLID